MAMTEVDMIFQSDIDHWPIAFQYSSKWIFKPCAIQEAPAVLCVCDKDTASMFCLVLILYEA